jgi:hypothetical protein
LGSQIAHHQRPIVENQLFLADHHPFMADILGRTLGKPSITADHQPLIAGLHLRNRGIQRSNPGNPRPRK